MTDFERTFRTALSDVAVASPPAPDLADRLLNGVTHVRRPQRRWVGPLLAVAAAVIVIIALVIASQANRQRTHPVKPANLPTGFTTTSLQFLDAKTGWALGAGRCGTQVCQALVSTTDGGTSWHRLTLPGDIDVSPPGTCLQLTSTTCAAHILFGNRSDGYLFSRNSLYSTVDGGRTWRTDQATGLQNLQIVATTVYRVRAVGTSASPRYRLDAAPVGTADWHDVTPSHQPSAFVARMGGNAGTVYLDAASPGARPKERIYASHDGGQHWQVIAGQLCTSSEEEVDSFAIDGTVAVNCDERLLVKPISSTTFVRAFLTQDTPGSRTLHAPEANVVTGSLMFVTDATPLAEWRSADHGRTWRLTRHLPFATPVTFATPSVGWASAADGKSYYLTVDAGRTWQHRLIR
jgi:hypothetical protein